MRFALARCRGELVSSCPLELELDAVRFDPVDILEHVEPVRRIGPDRDQVGDAVVVHRGDAPQPIAEAVLEGDLVGADGLGPEVRVGLLRVATVVVVELVHIGRAERLAKEEFQGRRIPDRIDHAQPRVGGASEGVVVVVPHPDVQDEIGARAELVLQVQGPDRRLPAVVQIEEIRIGVVVSLLLPGVIPNLRAGDHLLAPARCGDRLHLAGPPASIPIVLRQARGGIGIVALVPVAVVRGRSHETRRWRQSAVVLQIEEGPLVDGPGPGVVEQRPERRGQQLDGCEQGQRDSSRTTPCRTGARRCRRRSVLPTRYWSPGCRTRGRTGSARRCRSRSRSRTSRPRCRAWRRKPPGPQPSNSSPLPRQTPCRSDPGPIG